MDREIHAIKKNDTYKFTNLPEGKKTFGIKWIYKTNVKGKVQRYKTRLVKKCYKSSENIVLIMEKYLLI